MRGIKSAVIICCVFALAGCVGIKESVKGVAGVSTKVLEDRRPDAVKKVFNYGYAACYDKTVDVLHEIGAYIYAQPANNKMVAIYISEQDTTPVGLFFQAIENDKTQIEVSSPSTYGKELIASKVFSALGKKPSPPAVK